MATTKYHDRFASRNELIWMTKNRRSINSSDVNSILNQNLNKMRIPLFVRKKKIEGDFYYLGDSMVLPESAVEKTIPDDNGKPTSVVEMNLQLKTPVEKSLYDYLVSTD